VVGGSGHFWAGGVAADAAAAGAEADLAGAGGVAAVPAAQDLADLEVAAAVAVELPGVGECAS
jgi:hypothetical protein